MKDKVILVGHGGSGKDYLSDYLIKKKFKKSISYTTRPIRNNETDGITYHYITLDDFKQKIKDDFWHEYNVFANDWHYGSSKDDFDNSNLFIKEPHGVSLLSEKERDRSLIIYVNIDESIRRDRLSSRNDADNVDRRLSGDRKDFNEFNDYDLLITNPNFNCESIFYKILSETNIKPISTLVYKEMLIHNTYLTYSEIDNNISFSDFTQKILTDLDFSEKYKTLLKAERASYLNHI